MKTLKQILKELKDDSLGKTAFGSSRNDSSGPYKSEPDNELEKHILSDLDTFIQSDHIRIPDKTANVIKNILKTNSYRDVFNEPERGTVLFRGLTAKTEWVQKITKEDVTGKDSISKQTHNVYKSAYGSTSSWTDNEMIALQFTMQKLVEQEDNWCVILVANVNDNDNIFFSGPDGFYQVANLDLHSNERESISIGYVKLRHIIAVRSTDPYLFDTLQSLLREIE